MQGFGLIDKGLQLINFSSASNEHGHRIASRCLVAEEFDVQDVVVHVVHNQVVSVLGYLGQFETCLAMFTFDDATIAFSFFRLKTYTAHALMFALHDAHDFLSGIDNFGAESLAWIVFMCGLECQLIGSSGYQLTAFGIKIHLPKSGRFIVGVFLFGTLVGQYGLFDVHARCQAFSATTMILRRVHHRKYPRENNGLIEIKHAARVSSHFVKTGAKIGFQVKSTMALSIFDAKFQLIHQVAVGSKQFHVERFAHLAVMMVVGHQHIGFEPDVFANKVIVVVEVEVNFFLGKLLRKRLIMKYLLTQILLLGNTVQSGAQQEEKKRYQSLSHRLSC